MGSRDVVAVEEVVCIKETLRAVLCACPDGQKVWIPKSQLMGGNGDSEVWGEGVVKTIFIPEWLAKEKGLL